MQQNDAATLRESKSISNQSVKIDSSQSNVVYIIDNTKFKNPVFKIAPLDNFQSFSDNKYSHIFSSIIQSPRQEEQQKLNQQGIQQISKKRAFSLTEVETIKKDHRQNASEEIRIQKSIIVSSTRELECKRKKDDNQLNAETPKLGKNQLNDSLLNVKQKVDQQLYYSPRHIDDKLNDNYNYQAQKTQTTAWDSISSKSELDQILKECLLNFERNKAIKAEEYVACLIF
ncbi:unnamed protein product [Paramecium sonneborni]|uniref:Uncharacterized protein n=1 Tax=Paramecium sonneborni TaxID=65129 RepID=A0A8S1NI62_9CILI|nr:unnamed protein product [Paramecium sonneborni]